LVGDAEKILEVQEKSRDRYLFCYSYLFCYRL